jgi:hypothetical protein
MGEIRIGAADHHGLAELEHIGRHGVHLGRTDRAEEGDDVGLRGELREREHDAGIGGLVVFDDQFGLLAQNAAGLVDRFKRELGALDGIAARLRGGAGDRRAHADLDRRALRACTCNDVGNDMGCGNTGHDAGREIASRKLHSKTSLGPGILVGPSWCWRSVASAKTGCCLRILAPGVN